MKIKKILAGVLGFATLAASITLTEINLEILNPISASARVETSGKCGDNVFWEYDDGYFGTVKISGTGKMWDFDKDSPFCGNYSVSDVVIESGVTSIGKATFWDCSLEEIEIPDTVKSIGDCAFVACSNLTNIEIPDSITSIGDFTFFTCINLTSIEILDSVKSIGSNAFKYCSNLTDVYFDGTKSEWDKINIDADNDELKNANINFSDQCGDDVFFNLSANGVLKISGTGKTYSYGRSSIFSFNSEIKSVIIEDGITLIGSSLFSYCDSLVSVTIPDTVSEIDEGAFQDCYSLRDVYFAGVKSEWEKVNIDASNDLLRGATIHFSDGSVLEPPLGDLNNDNSIDSKDAVIVLKDYAQALVSGSSAFKAAGDVNKDGKEDSKDAVKILRYYASKLAGVYDGNIADFK